MPTLLRARRYKAKRRNTAPDAPLYALKGMKGTMYGAADGIPIAAIREIAVRTRVGWRGRRVKGLRSCLPCTAP